MRTTAIVPFLTATLLLGAHQLFAAPAPAEKAEPGLLAEYFSLDDSIEDFPTVPASKKPTLKRVDKTVDVESTSDAWPRTELLDHFYIRWTGKLRAPKAGKYSFFLESDDGSRLYLDGKDLTRLPLAERKEILRRAFTFRDPLRFVEHRVKDGEKYPEWTAGMSCMDWNLEPDLGGGSRNCAVPGETTLEKQ